MAASYDPATGLVRLGVADCGQGIAADIRDRYGSEFEEGQAVEMALEPKVSGSQDEDLNQGVGLYIVRRLALAGEGAFWIKTGHQVVSASAHSPDLLEPRVEMRGAYWQGTAVAVSLKAGLIDNCMRAIWAIRDQLETSDVQIFGRSPEEDGWIRIRVEPDLRKVALDRVRARELARLQVLPRLDEGCNVTLDFSNTRTTTQAFCYALLGAAARRHGPELLERLRFVSVSKQVRPLILMAIHSGFQEREED